MGKVITPSVVQVTESLPRRKRTNRQPGSVLFPAIWTTRDMLRMRMTNAGCGTCAACKSVAQALNELGPLAGAFICFADEAEKLLKRGDRRMLAMMMFQLGKFDTHMALNKLAEIGAGCRSGAKHGGETRRLSDEEVQLRTVDYQAAVNELLRKNPHMQYTAATDRVGDKFGFSGRHIRKYTRDPRK